MTKVIKISSLRWAPKAHSALKEVKTNLTEALIPALPCFDKVFEIKYDSSGVGIGGVLTQEG